MSELKPVEEMSLKDLVREFDLRGGNCHDFLSLMRMGIKWLRFDQDGIDAVLKDLNLDRNDIYDNGYYHSILRRILEEREDRKDSKQPDLDWGELVELLDDLKETAELMSQETKDVILLDAFEKEQKQAQEWIDRLTAAFGPFDDEPVELSESEESDCVPEKPKGFEGVHEWVWVNDGWELKRIEGAEQPAPLDIDTPTLKRRGSRFLVLCDDDGWVYPIDIRRDRLNFGPLVGNTLTIDVFRRHEEDSQQVVVTREDARIIQNAWLERGR